MIGARLNGWVLDKELGRGGMGVVYLAHREVPSGQKPDQAAIKVLAAELAQESGFRERFQREIDALRQLNHPNIVQFYDAGLQDGVYFCVMEYVPGRSVEGLLLEKGRLPWKDVLEIALQVVPALKHAHDHGIIHRDLKPQNLMCAEDGTIKLTDFGIAKVFASRQLTTTGGLVGTAEYLSPEQAAGKPVTNRSDLYSLGVLLYTLLTGRTPFEGTSIVDLLHKHRFAQFDRPGRIVPAIPYEFDEIVCQLLEKDPANRPANGLVLQRQLEGLRRKLDRKDQRTLAGTPDGSTRAEGPEEDSDEPSAEGSATLMSRLMRQELLRANRGGPLAQFFNRPWVLVSLLALCVALGWYFWPRPTVAPATLFERGSSLMASSNPDDWEKAWDEYLEPLNRQYPDHPYHQQVERFHQQLEDYAQLQRAVAKVKADGPPSEAQRFFQQGLTLCQQGDIEQARRIWQATVQAFHEVESERRWVRLAEEALAQLPNAASREDPRRLAIRAVAEKAQELRKRGDAQQAEQLWSGLEELYRGDPSVRSLLDEARRDFGS